MDRIETYPMGLDEVPQTQAYDVAPSTGERSRHWADTKPAEGPPRTALQSRTKRSRSLARFSVVLALCGLAAYALHGLFGR